MILIGLLILCIKSEILKLTNQNFNQIIRQKQPTIVYFSNKNCEPCDKLEPEFKLASELSQLVTFGEVKAQEEKEIVNSLNIQWFPLILFYKDQKVMTYKGDRSSANIITFIKKEVLGPITVIQDKSEIQSDNYVILYTDNPDIISNFKLIVSNYFLTDFFLINSNLNQIEFNINGNQILPINSDLHWLIVQNMKSLEFNSDSAFMTFENKFPTLFIFYSQEQPPKILSQIDQINQKNILVFTVEQNSSWGEKLKKYFQISKVPQIMIVKAAENEIKKNYLEIPYDIDLVNNFIDDFQNGKLDKIKSQSIIPNQNNRVYQMVGLEFNQIVFDKSKAVLTWIYNQLDSNVKYNNQKSVQIFENLAQKYREIQFTKIDATLNDIPKGIKYDKLPFFIMTAAKTNAIKTFKDISEIDDFLSHYVVGLKTEI